MQRIGAQFLADSNQEMRLKGTREFVKLLVEALKVENSFQYKFDSWKLNHIYLKVQNKF